MPHTLSGKPVNGENPQKITRTFSTAEAAAPPATEPSTTGQPPQGDKPAGKLPLVTIELACGDVALADAPVAVTAHYRRLPLAGTAKQFDLLLKSWLTRAQELGMIGGGLGELFRVSLASVRQNGRGGSRRRGRRPPVPVKADDLLLMGMGDPGAFGPDDLRLLMTNVTIAVKVLRKPAFCTSLIGVRRGEMSVEASARGFLQGLNDGFERCHSIIESLGDERAQFEAAFFGELKVLIVERDRGLLREARKRFDELARDRGWRKEEQFDLTVCKGPEVGQLDQSDGGESGDGEESSDTVGEDKKLTLLHIARPPAPAAATSGAGAANAPRPEDPTTILQFSAISHTATAPVREQEANRYFFRQLPGRLQQARTLAEQEKYGSLWSRYLIPEDFRRMIEPSDHLRLVLDADTACYPWEMVAIRGHGGTRFLGTDFQLTRMFRTLLAQTPGMAPPLNNHLRVLVIADPASHAPLPHARAEGLAVVAALQTAQRLWGSHYHFRVDLRLGSSRPTSRVDDVLARLRKGGQVGPGPAFEVGEPPARRPQECVIESAEPCEPLELLYLIIENEYDVVHYAGHGQFDPDTGYGGWLLDEGCLLTATEIFGVRQVPRLVFANACFSAATSDYDHRRQRVGLAQAFFARGIQNFIGTGWEVADESAGQLAAAFYRKVCGIFPDKAGKEAVHPSAPPATLGFALAESRRLIQNQGSTWGAYQHYGEANAKLLPVRNRADA